MTHSSVRNARVAGYCRSSAGTWLPQLTVSRIGDFSKRTLDEDTVNATSTPHKIAPELDNSMQSWDVSWWCFCQTQLPLLLCEAFTRSGARPNMTLVGLVGAWTRKTQ